MSLRIQVTNTTQHKRFRHSGQPLEFGRGPAGQFKRCVINDVSVSRDQLRVEELPDGRVRIENLSRKNPVNIFNGSWIEPLRSLELEPPIRLSMGNTHVLIDRFVPKACAAESFEESTESSTSVTATPLEESGVFDMEALIAVEPPAPGRPGGCLIGPAGYPPPKPAPDYLAEWLETVIQLQDAAADSPKFYARTAQALVSLVDLDLGLVLLRRNDRWAIAGSAVADSQVSARFSRTLVNHVVAQKKTFFRDLNKLSSQSLKNIESAVASPIFGLEGDVVGVLYGVRTRRNVLARGDLDPLQAQLVHLLAAAAGANLARTLAVKTRVQFEQFFSPELVRELERDPQLLEGRSDQVTVLFCDLRGFTALSQRLGAQVTCRVLRDMMERLSGPIVTHGGVIVDYAGDGILAMWNAPAKQPDHPARACRAALEMLDELALLNDRWAEETGRSLAIGIGVNTGEARVGNTGSNRKLKYGPHGHCVNLASRVQDATKKLELPLLITETTREQLPASFHTRRLGQFRLPGIKEVVLLFEVHGETATPEWLARRDAYENALTLYESAQWSQACQALVPLWASDRPECYDAPTLKLMRRSWECLESQPESFEPIVELNTK